jgi:hypothetical protein
MADDEKPTVINVEFTRNEAKAALEELKRSVPEMVASNREIAKVLRSKYLALVESGFTPKEALRLCKKLEW